MPCTQFVKMREEKLIQNNWNTEMSESVMQRFWQRVRQDYEQTSSPTEPRLSPFDLIRNVLKNRRGFGNNPHGASAGLICWQKKESHCVRRERGHNGHREKWLCLFGDDYTACSNVTYVPSTRNMFHIILGAQARRDVTVVHFFGEYLNLQQHGGADGKDGTPGRFRLERKTTEEESRSF